MGFSTAVALGAALILAVSALPYPDLGLTRVTEVVSRVQTSGSESDSGGSQTSIATSESGGNSGYGGGGGSGTVGGGGGGGTSEVSVGGNNAYGHGSGENKRHGDGGGTLNLGGNRGNGHNSGRERGGNNGNVWGGGSRQGARVGGGGGGFLRSGNRGGRINNEIISRYRERYSGLRNTRLRQRQQGRRRGLYSVLSSVNQFTGSLSIYKYLRIAFSNQKCGKAIAEISQYNKPASDLDSMVYVFFRYISIIKEVMNVWIEGSGTLYENEMIVIFRYTLCNDDHQLAQEAKSKGSGSPKFCSPDYGVSEFGWERYEKSYSYEDLSSYYFSTSVEQQMTTYFEDGSKFNSGSQQIIYQSCLEVSQLLSKDSNSWTRDDLISVWMSSVTVFGTIMSSYNTRLGYAAVNGYFSYCSELATKWNVDMDAQYKIVVKKMSGCSRYSFNGALTNDRTSFRLNKKAGLTFFYGGSKMFNKRHTQYAREIAQCGKRAKNMDEACVAYYRVGRLCRGLLNDWSKDQKIGTRYFEMIRAISVISACTPNGHIYKKTQAYGYALPSVCSKHQFSSADEVIEYYKVKNCIEDMESRVQTLTGGQGFSHQNEKALYEIITFPSDLLSKDSSSWSEDDMIKMSYMPIEMVAIFSNSYNEKLGVPVLHSWFEYCRSVSSQYKISYDSYISEATTVVSTTKQYDYGGITQTSQDVNVVDDDDSNTQQSSGTSGTTQSEITSNSQTQSEVKTESKSESNSQTQSDTENQNEGQKQSETGSKNEQKQQDQTVQNSGTENSQDDNDTEYEDYYNYDDEDYEETNDGGSVSNGSSSASGSTSTSGDGSTSSSSSSSTSTSGNDSTSTSASGSTSTSGDGSTSTSASGSTSTNGDGSTSSSTSTSTSTSGSGSTSNSGSNSESTSAGGSAGSSAGSSTSTSGDGSASSSASSSTITSGSGSASSSNSNSASTSAGSGANQDYDDLDSDEIEYIESKDDGNYNDDDSSSITTESNESETASKNKYERREDSRNEQDRSNSNSEQSTSRDKDKDSGKVDLSSGSSYSTENQEFTFSSFVWYSQIMQTSQNYRNIYINLSKYKRRAQNYEEIIDLLLKIPRGVNGILNDIVRGYKKIQKEIPEIYNYMWQCYGAPTKLMFGEKEVASCVGVEQGDPLGPAIFSLVGDLFVNVMLTIMKPACCSTNGPIWKIYKSNGWDQPKICNQYFGKRWGLKQYKGKTYSVAEASKIYSTCQATSTIEEAMGKLESDQVTEKVILKALYTISGYINKDITDWTDDDMNLAIGKCFEIVGATAGGYNAKMGAQVIRELYQYTEILSSIYKNYSTYQNESIQIVLTCTKFKQDYGSLASEYNLQENTGGRRNKGGKNGNKGNRNGSSGNQSNGRTNTGAFSSAGNSGGKSYAVAGSSASNSEGGGGQSLASSSSDSNSRGSGGQSIASSSSNSNSEGGGGQSIASSSSNSNSRGSGGQSLASSSSDSNSRGSGGQSLASSSSDSNSRGSGGQSLASSSSDSNSRGSGGQSLASRSSSSAEAAGGGGGGNREGSSGRSDSVSIHQTQAYESKSGHGQSQQSEIKSRNSDGSYFEAHKRAEGGTESHQGHKEISRQKTSNGDGSSMVSQNENYASADRTSEGQSSQDVQVVQQGGQTKMKSMASNSASTQETHEQGEARHTETESGNGDQMSSSHSSSSFSSSSASSSFTSSSSSVSETYTSDQNSS